jgi:hypothetical protein
MAEISKARLDVSSPGVMANERMTALTGGLLLVLLALIGVTVLSVRTLSMPMRSSPSWACRKSRRCIGVWLPCWPSSTGRTDLSGMRFVRRGYQLRADRPDPGLQQVRARTTDPSSFCASSKHACTHTPGSLSTSFSPIRGSATMTAPGPSGARWWECPSKGDLLAGHARMACSA